MLKIFSIVSLFALLGAGLINGCSPSGSSNGHANLYLSNGQPVIFAIQHPDLVPVVTCPDGSQGVVICHYPPGNPTNAQTLCVGFPAVQAHVSHHGDTVGACGSTPGATPTPTPMPTATPAGSPPPFG